jgi:hypothetical protein
VTVKGKVPSAGATIWSGEYEIIGNTYLACPTDRQANTFTATALAPLSGNFSGSITMQYSFAEPPLPTYSGPRTYKANFNIAARQREAHLAKSVSLSLARVTGGKCDKQFFQGTLERQ